MEQFFFNTDQQILLHYVKYSQLQLIFQTCKVQIFFEIVNLFFILELFFIAKPPDFLYLYILKIFMQTFWKTDMAKYYFISDIHTGAGTESDERKKLIKLKSFFNFIKQPGNELFIVGDLFDYWFEYKHAVPNKFYSVLFEISKLIESDVAVHFLRGNHDCWLQDFLKKQVKIDILPDLFTTEIHSKKTFIFHGDGILKSDSGYRLLKKIFRHPLNIFLFRCLHPDIGIPLTKRMSQTSRFYTSSKIFDYTNEYIDYAALKFSQGYDYVILGHSHEPLLKKIDGKVLINLGDWIKHFSYGMISNGTLSLNFWNS